MQPKVTVREPLMSGSRPTSYRPASSSQRDRRVSYSAGSGRFRPTKINSRQYYSFVSADDVRYFAICTIHTACWL